MNQVKKVGSRRLSDKNGHGTAVLSTDDEAQLRLLLDALRAMEEGDFSVRLPMTGNGVMGEIVQTFNGVIGLNERMAKETARFSKVVGEEGNLASRINILNYVDIEH